MAGGAAGSLAAATSTVFSANAGKAALCSSGFCSVAGAAGLSAALLLSATKVSLLSRVSWLPSICTLFSGGVAISVGASFCTRATGGFCASFAAMLFSALGVAAAIVSSALAGISALAIPVLPGALSAFFSFFAGLSFAAISVFFAALAGAGTVAAPGSGMTRVLPTIRLPMLLWAKEPRLAL